MKETEDIIVLKVPHLTGVGGLVPGKDRPVVIVILVVVPSYLLLVGTVEPTEEYYFWTVATMLISLKVYL